MHTEPQDVWVEADLLVKRYGETAPDKAAERADRQLRAGKTEAQVAWLRVVTATKAVLARDVSTV